MGVSMLPRLAATVWSTAMGTSSRSCPARRSTVMPKGMKVMSATSFVMTMLNAKGRNTSSSIMLRVVEARRSSLPARQTNTPASWKPFITAIREKSSASVSQSM